MSDKIKMLLTKWDINVYVSDIKMDEEDDGKLNFTVEWDESDLTEKGLTATQLEEEVGKMILYILSEAVNEQTAEANNQI